MNRDLIIVLSIFIIFLIGIGSYLAIDNNNSSDFKNNSSKNNNFKNNNSINSSSMNNSNINSTEKIGKIVLNDINISKDNLKNKNNNISKLKNRESKNSSNSSSINYATKHSPQQIEKISSKILDKYPEAFGDSSIVKVSTVKYDYETGLWVVSYADRKTGKYVGRTYIIDETGKMPIM
ncbi:MAG: hypothetical protein FWE58_02620 [Methanobrevibacter sp.]|nr:hypothetical protein [Methanobrevibacter sp.]